MSNVDETIQGMKSKFNPSAAAGMDLVRHSVVVA